MKNLLIIFSILGLIGGGIVIYLFNKNTHSENKNPSYDSARLSTSDSESTTKNSDTNQNTDNSNTHTENKQESETQISEFTTKIYTKDEERQNNINITCSSLNDTYVEVHADSSCPRVLWMPPCRSLFRLPGSHRLWPAFPGRSTTVCGLFGGPKPRMYRYTRFGLLRFRSPLLAESRLISFPLPT